LTTGMVLDHLNTLGVPSRAQRLEQIQSREDLLRLAAEFAAEGYFVLGGGSNVVLAEAIDQPVCLMCNRGIELVQHGDKVAVTAAAGERWHDLVRWTLGKGLGGLENLALIPGSVGAAPVQNIGAYGVELNNLFLQLQALDVRTGEMIVLDKNACEFSYRSSLFKSHPGRYIISDVTLLLDAHSRGVNVDYPDVAAELTRLGVGRPRPADVAEAVIRVRRRKLPDPRFVPNVGSFFKNPVISRQQYDALPDTESLRHYDDEAGVKLSAAQLIDRSGGKTLRAGGLSVWARQPLVLTNPGHQTGREVLAFARQIQDAVRGRFGVRLQIEPDTVGF
jgi:UDP-N-acetylmuramate dehydrogenase